MLLITNTRLYGHFFYSSFDGGSRLNSKESLSEGHRVENEEGLSLLKLPSSHEKSLLGLQSQRMSFASKKKKLYIYFFEKSILCKNNIIRIDNMKRKIIYKNN